MFQQGQHIWAKKKENFLASSPCMAEKIQRFRQTIMYIDRLRHRVIVYECTRNSVHYMSRVPRSACARRGIRSFTLSTSQFTLSASFCNSEHKLRARTAEEGLRVWISHPSEFPRHLVPLEQYFLTYFFAYDPRSQFPVPIFPNSSTRQISAFQSEVSVLWLGGYLILPAWEHSWKLGN